MKMIKIYTVYLLLVFCAVNALATAKEEDPIKLIRPKLLNPFDDPDKAVELASLAAVVHNEPPAAEGRKTDFKSALSNAKMDADEADLETAKDDLKLLSTNDSCDDTDPNCQKKIDEAIKREKKRWKKRHKAAFLELDGSFDPEEEDMEEEDFDKPHKHKKHSSHKDEDKMEQHSQHKQKKQLRLKPNSNNNNKNKHHNHHHRKQHHKPHHHRRHSHHHQKHKQHKQHKPISNKHSKNKRSAHKIRGEMKHHRQDNENDKDDKFNDDFDDPMFDKDLKDWKSEKTNSMQSSTNTKTVLQQSPYTNTNPSAPAAKPSVPSSSNNFAKSSSQQKSTPSKYADKLSDLDDDVFLEKEQSVSNANKNEEPMFIEATPVVPVSSLKIKSQ